VLVAARAGAGAANELIPMPPSDPIAGSRCLRARRTLSAAIDQEATAPELRRAALHLARCPCCRAFFAEIDAVSSLLRTEKLAPRYDSRHR